MGFAQDFVFTRGTGATRINAAGLIVGVDFSSTSNTIGTGSKTFTLTADANVNRDWPVGSSVIAVSQAGATGTMTGVVTSYTPSTQSLVINVTSVTGSGTSTNWRIGSLDVRRDANGVLQEGQASNLFTFSKQFDNAAWTKGRSTVTPNATQSVDGSNTAFALVEDTTANNTHFLSQTVTTVTGRFYRHTRYVKVNPASPQVRDIVVLRYAGVAGSEAIFNLSTALVVQTNSKALSPTIKSVGNGWFACSVTWLAEGTSIQASLDMTNNGNNIYTGDGVSSIFVDYAQIEEGFSEASIIPTTTVAVTRAADSITASSTVLNAIKQGEGTVVVTALNTDNGISQKRALRLTGATGEIRIAKTGTGTTANFTKMAEGAGLRLMGTASNLLSNDGLESSAVSATFAETGTLTAVGQTNAITFNGTNTFGRVGSTEESVLDSLLSTRQMRGLGGTQINGAHWTGTSFIAATAVAGRVMKTVDGISYRSINAPVITQPTNEVTSGLVGGTNRVVIVGNGGFIATSDDDGETWTARTSGTTQPLAGVSFGSVGGTNYFIAVGQGSQARYSTDGVTWTNATGLGTNSFSDVHIANGIAVATSLNNGAIYVSTNGTTYTAATNTNTTQSLNGVTYSPTLNLWIAVGNVGTVITATNPAGTWTVQTSGTGSLLTEVAIFNNAIYIVGGTQTLLTSTNGTTYTSLTAGVAGNLNGIAASPTTLLITGTGGAMASSTDGTTFTSRTNNNQTLNGIAFGAGRFVSVGNAANGSGYIATIDPDGTVTRRVSGTTAGISNVKFLNGGFIANQESQTTGLKSSDGITWTTINYTTSNNSSAFGNGIYVTNRGALLSGATVFMVSTDNTTYSQQSFSLGGTLLVDIEFANNVFVAVGTGGGIVTIANSGTTLTPVRRTAGTTQDLKSVMYSTRDSRWYAAGNAGTLLFSEDNGVTWQSVQNAGLVAVTNNGPQANELFAQWKSGINRAAVSFKANSVIGSLNGISMTDTLATIPNFTALTVGDNFNGYIKSVKFFNEAVTAAELNAMTGI